MFLNRKGRDTFYVLIVFLALAFAMLLGLCFWDKAGAEDGLPPSVQVFEVGDHTCVLYEFKNGVGGTEAELECFCPCEAGCRVDTRTIQEVIDDGPEGPTPKPTNKPPDPTPKPEKVKCNSGRGNASEGDPDCDPGNSGGHNQGGD